MTYLSAVPCRAVYVAIPVCVLGVLLITQPSWLGHGTRSRSALGITLAIGQVQCMTPPTTAMHLMKPVFMYMMHAHTR